MQLDFRSASGIIVAIVFGSWEYLHLMGLTDATIKSGEHRRPVSQLVKTTDKDPKITDSDESSMKKVLSLNEKISISEQLRCLEKKVAMLKSARAFIAAKKNYTANLTKREVVRGELLDEQSMSMKVRLNPFSVYLRWNVGDVGREVIYIEGVNEGKMIAHDGGWKSRIPAFHLTPNCTLAMRDARYPITSAGLLFLIDTMLVVHQDDLKTRNIRTCQITSDQDFDGRPSLVVTTDYQSKEVSPIYRKSITTFDRESSVPVSTEHFEWPTQSQDASESDLDKMTLIERYVFHDLTFDESISDYDFDRSNREYNFR